MDLGSWLAQPPWWLQVLIYALLTAFFGAILAPIVVERYRERRRAEETRRTERVQKAKNNIERSKTRMATVKFKLVDAIDSDLKDVNEIKFFDQHTSRKADILSTAREFPDISPIARRYVAAIDEASAWRDAIRKLLKPLIADLVTSDFPQTMKLTVEDWGGWKTLEAALQEALVDPIIRGDKLNRELVDQLMPQLSTQIDKEAVKGEGIPKFLKSLNEMVAREPSLARFRTWQETTRTIGKELREAASHNVASLQKEAQEWKSYLAQL